MPSVGLYYDPLFLEHDNKNIERPARLQSAMRLLEESGLIKRLERRDSRDATEAELTRVHGADYVDAIRRASERGPVSLDPDTIASPRSFDAASRSAGACLAATEAVMSGDLASAFCLVRPPGHHATPRQAMGFCIFNSIAVAAAHARDALGLERVAIVDYDLHHGNGTEDAFYRDGNILYVSTHQYPLYPFTGDWHEAGSGEGEGATLNLPMPAGCGDREYARVFDEVVLPKLRDFQPQLILVSAGYDAHFMDSISGAAMRLSCAGFASLTARLRDAAAELCDGKLVLALEGGYDLTAIAWSVRNSIEALLGEDVTPDPLGLPAARHPSPDVEPLIGQVKQLHGL